MDSIMYNAAHDMYACKTCGYNTKEVSKILYHIAHMDKECQPPAYLTADFTLEIPPSHAHKAGVDHDLSWFLKNTHL